MNGTATQRRLSNHEREIQDLDKPERRKVVSGVTRPSANVPQDNVCHPSQSSVQKPRIQRGLTFWLFIPTVLLVVTLFAAFCHNVIPWWLNWTLASPLYYLIVICGHDAFHASAHGTRRGNNLVGWVASLMFAIPFPMARQALLRHHSRTGTCDDIERHGYHIGITLPIRILVGNWLYYLHLPKCNREEKGEDKGDRVCRDKPVWDRE